MNGSFCWSLNNHAEPGLSTLYDIVDAIGGQMLDLGYQGFNSPTRLMNPPVVNVMIEGFDEPYVEKFRRLKEIGAKVVVIMTERAGKPGWNDYKVPHMVVRQDMFMKIAPMATAIWCLVPGMAEWCRQFNPNSIDLELGHSPTRERLQHIAHVPLHDFAFFGSMTPRRAEIIGRFNRRGFRVLTEANNKSFLPPRERDELAVKAKVILGIDPWPRWRLISNSRIATALTLGRPVLCEPPRIKTPWSEAGVFARSSFVDEAIAMLPKWQEHRDRQVAKFRELFSPERCVGEAIRRTLPEMA